MECSAAVEWAVLVHGGAGAGAFTLGSSCNSVKMEGSDRISSVREERDEAWDVVRWSKRGASVVAGMGCVSLNALAWSSIYIFAGQRPEILVVVCATPFEWDDVATERNPDHHPPLPTCLLSPFPVRARLCRKRGR